MKTKVFVLFLLLISQKFAISEHFSSKDIQIYLLEKKVAEIEEKVAYLEKFKDTLKQVKQVSEYFWKLGELESGCKYDTTNTLGYLGKYQFGIQTLKSLGFNCTPEEFLSNPLLQEQAIIALNIYNDRLLRKKLDYDSLRIDYLAGAHLGGAGSVIKLVRENTDVSDVFGTTVSEYIQNFKNQ